MAERPSADELLIEEIAVDDEDETLGVIAIATINRPDKLNALNQQVYSALKQTCAWVEHEEQVRLLIIKGAEPNEPPEGKRAKPRSFVAGADISEFQGKGSVDIRQSFTDNAWEAIWNLSKPTIAMIDGFALGGGLEVALSCDIRVVSETSRFATPEINLGLIPGGGGTQRLARLVGYGKAIEMVMSGEMIDANSALTLGLVNHVCQANELESTTMELAKNIASKSAHTLRIAKKVVRSALEKPLNEGVEIEAIEFAGLFDSEDKEIGVNAFLNREKAVWKNR